MNKYNQINNQKNNGTQKGFFSKKKIITFGILFAITIGLIVFTLIGVLDINFIELFNNIGQSLKTYKLAILFLILLIVFPFVKVINNIFYFYLVLKRMGIKVRKRDWFSLACVVFFIVFVTPSSLGSEPFYIYWLNKKIFDVKKSSAICLANSVIGELSALIVTAPSFIYFCTQYNLITEYGGGNIVFWFAVIGVSVDWIVMFSLIVLVYSKKTHYFFSLCFHKTKKFFNLKHKSKEEIISETIGEAVFKKEAIKILKMYSCTIWGFVWYCIFNVLIYVYMYFSLGVLTDLATVNFLDVFNYMNVGVTANNFVPLPGSEGSLQLILKIMLQPSFNNLSEEQTTLVINQGIFVWRLFTTQIPAVFGMVFMSGYIFKSVNISRNKKINNNLTKSYNEVLLIFDENKYLLSDNKTEKYFDLLKQSMSDKTFKILDIEKAALSFEKGIPYLYKRDKWLKKTNEFNFKEFTLKNYLSFLKAKKKLVQYNSKIIKGYLKTKNYETIIDFSFFGLKIFAGHKNYFWIQNRSYDEIRGKLFFSSFENFFSTWLKKFTFGFDPFYYIYNVVITNDNDKNIGNNDNFIYINNLDNKQIKELFVSVDK